MSSNGVEILGGPVKKATIDKTKVSQRKSGTKLPLRKLAINVKRHNVWDKFKTVNAGLSVVDWLAIDREAQSQMMEGLRTLRSRKRARRPSPVVPDEDIIIVDEIRDTDPVNIAAVRRWNTSVIHEDSDYDSAWSTDTEEDIDEEESEEGSVIDYPYSLSNMRMSAPLTAPISINGHVVFAIFDSGASVSVLSEKLANRLLLEPNGDKMDLVAFNSKQSNNSGIVPKVPVMVAGHLRPEHMCIHKTTPDDKREDLCILGMTWFKAYHVLVDLKTCIVSFPRVVNGKFQEDPSSGRIEIQGSANRVARTLRMSEEVGTNHTTSVHFYDDDTASITPDFGSEVYAVTISGDKISNPAWSSTTNRLLKPYHEDVIDASDDEEEVEDMTGGIDISKVPEFLRKLVDQYRDCFVEVSGLGRVNIAQHRIETLENATPITSKPFRMSWSEQEQLKKELTEMMNLGLIRPSSGTWCSPCFFIKKKATANNPNPGLRMLIDYRRLNAICPKTPFPLPVMDDLLDSLAGAKYFTTLDAASGYYQVPLHPDDIEKSAFITPRGTYEFLVMAFGLNNAPYQYQRMMTTLLQDYIGEFVFVFIDDIIVFSDTQENHAVHLKLVLEKCKSANLRLKWKKCTWGDQEGVEYLGHKISPGGLLPNVANTEKIVKFPRPLNVTALRSFLGTTGFYRRFCDNYARVVQPLNKLLKKSVEYTWGAEQQNAFETLKTMLTSPPLLAFPDKTMIQILTTDGSGVAIACILSQYPENEPQQETVISYNSRCLRDTEVGYSAVHIEALAIVWAVQKYKYYLTGRKFILRTDNVALVWILKPNAKPSPKLSRWAASLSEFDYEVQHISGVTNPSDSLSRYLPEDNKI